MVGHSGGSQIHLTAVHLDADRVGQAAAGNRVAGDIDHIGVRRCQEQPGAGAVCHLIVGNLCTGVHRSQPDAIGAGSDRVAEDPKAAHGGVVGRADVGVAVDAVVAAAVHRIVLDDDCIPALRIADVDGDTGIDAVAYLVDRDVDGIRADRIELVVGDGEGADRKRRIVIAFIAGLVVVIADAVITVADHIARDQGIAKNQVAIVGIPRVVDVEIKCRAGLAVEAVVGDYRVAKNHGVVVIVLVGSTFVEMVETVASTGKGVVVYHQLPVVDRRVAVVFEGGVVIVYIDAVVTVSRIEHIAADDMIRQSGVRITLHCCAGSIVIRAAVNPDAVVRRGDQIVGNRYRRHQRPGAIVHVIGHRVVIDIDAVHASSNQISGDGDRCDTDQRITIAIVALSIK